MRIVWLELRRYRRFEHARINLDAPVIALVGPNEAGKSSLLKALRDVQQPGEFDPRDITRGLQPAGRVLEATFLLDDADRASLRKHVPEASDVRWYRIWQDKSGELQYETIPSVTWTGEAAQRTRNTLIRLRDLKWAKSADETLRTRLDTIISWLAEPGETRTYDDHVLDEIEQFSADLETTIAPNTPTTLNRACDAITKMLMEERRQRPSAKALDFLYDRCPNILDFSESDRTIRTDYNLQDPSSWTNGLKNLARLAQFNLQELAEATAGPRSELREDILMNANARLLEVFAVRWSQSKLSVRVAVQGNQLEIFVATDGGNLHRLEERSDGLRTYLALVAFLDNKSLRVPPILVFDEAESHLHWDAQADLIKVLYDQEMASQVVYSTHSPGCLPHDLGHGVRALVPTAPDRSKVENWIWKDAAGFRPLLIHMGASTAALTPHRYALVTEGPSDFILLPSLIRTATGETSLPYQIVPGLAQLSRAGLRRIDFESDTLLYLTDGDDGGKDLKKLLKSAGISARRIFSLPRGITLEDLVSESTLVAAIREELRRPGHQIDEDISLPSSGRATHLATLYKKFGVDPGKRATACRILDMAARRPEEERLSLLEGRHRVTLSRLHESFIRAFGLNNVA